MEEVKNTQPEVVCFLNNCYFNFQKSLSQDELSMICRIDCYYCTKVYYCSQRCRELDWSQSHQSRCEGYIQKQNREQKQEENPIQAPFSPLKSAQEIEFLKADKNQASSRSKRVHRIKVKQYDLICACKVLNKQDLYVKENKEIIKEQIKTHFYLDHPHLLKIYSYFEDRQQIYIIMEYAKNGSLFQYIKRRKQLEEVQAFIYFFQACIAIDYLHQQNIVHGYLVSDYIFLDDNGLPKISLREDNSYLNKRGYAQTFNFWSPEVVQGLPGGKPSDIWSLSVLLYELVHSKPPFSCTTQDYFYRVGEGTPFQFSETVSQQCQDLISQMSLYNPEERAYFDEIFTHPWVIKNEKLLNLNISKYITNNQKENSPLGIKNGLNLEESQEQQIKEQRFSFERNTLFVKDDSASKKLQHSKRRLENNDFQCDDFLQQYGLQNSQEILLYKSLEQSLHAQRPSERSSIRTDIQPCFTFGNEQDDFEQQDYGRQPRISRVSARTQILENQNKKASQNQDQSFIDQFLNVFGCGKN